MTVHRCYGFNYLGGSGVGGGGSILPRPTVVLSRIILDKAKLFEEFRPVEYYEGFGVTAASLGHSTQCT